MRYDNWDIILFPEDSNIPIPEYRTACYFSRDEDGHELPTLRTYIGSLKPETPFRISVHHWGPPKPSPFIQEVQRRAGMNITFTVQVFIDNTRLYHGSFELNNSSPQEIAYEQRSFRSSRSHEQPTSQPKQRLLFPRSDKNALLQSSAWQPRGTDNRIKIILSERLVNEEGSLDVGCWDVVCFSFQHAHRELLEQAGIAYPIIDPLRSLLGERATFVQRSLPQNTMARQLQRGSRIHSEHSPESDSEPIRPANPEPHQQPPDRMPSMAIYPSAFMGHRGGGHLGIWHNSYGSFGDPDDDISMGSWPSQRYASHMSGLDGFYDPSFPPYAAPPWSNNAALPGQRAGPHMNNNRSRKDNGAQQVMMALRDDQFGQILEAISPSKKQRSLPHGLPAQRQDARQPSTQAHRPPKMGALSVPVRPSSAAIARTTAYPDFNAALRNSVKRPSSDQASFNTNAPSKTNPQIVHHSSRKENRDSRIPTPNPFMLGPQRWDSDVSMRDGSSNFSSLSRFERDPANLSSKIGSAHAPSAGGNVKSRKEGLATDTGDHLDIEVRHDQSLLPTVGANSIAKAMSTADDPDRTPRDRPNETSASVLNHVEVIDVDAIDPSLVAEPTADMAKLSPFKPGHRASMSSISSTGRLERQLYSALGEELGSFEQQMNTTGMGHELAQALSGTGTHSDLSGSTMLDPTVSEFEPVIKRKRQGTFGGERDKSPVKKKEKARQVMVEDDDISEDMPRLRGE
ncbi:hypothetical protein BU25DRAFT_491193 [Macroventuria anomochaeta]|uniref:Uncharacterized protein n=1 Tax=Macroventuria anomochaeta TaxID=301207 RepID=A0ACB6RZZ7_9PLEO|nr:uncharacterized protein BU25DRAFT_491193 [Macroventuria anomochaeta]KAF2627555.1 hypothetical protein BU25DRAFT_491193 [Macroventuria anomochaeta]